VSCQWCPRAGVAGAAVGGRRPSRPAAIASLRAIGERANAQLKQFKVLARDFRGSPTQITTVVKAIQTLDYWTRDPFTLAELVM
jgi:hypothetical protein